MFNNFLLVLYLLGVVINLYVVLRAIPCLKNFGIAGILIRIFKMLVIVISSWLGVYFLYRIARNQYNLGL